MDFYFYLSQSLNHLKYLTTLLSKEVRSIVASALFNTRSLLTFSPGTGILSVYTLIEFRSFKIVFHVKH